MKEVNHPNVKTGWDAWSPTLEGLSTEEIQASILKMKPYIVNTIAADYIRAPQYRYENSRTNYHKSQDVLRAVPMGEGIIDYKSFFSTLKEIGYQGHIVYELCEVLEGGGSEENLDKTAQKFLEYMEAYE
jgi:sugar phosphate isomerase/epimerase